MWGQKGGHKEGTKGESVHGAFMTDMGEAKMGFLHPQRQCFPGRNRKGGAPGFLKVRPQLGP